MNTNDKKTVSLPVIRRLPRYYRFLSLLQEKGIERISSVEISKKLGYTASQVRQDFNYFGEFGQQGYGYNVIQLKGEIHKILYLDCRVPAILIGVGNLGRALSRSLVFDSIGVTLLGMFDKKPENVKDIDHELDVLPLDDLKNYCTEYSPRLAILCIPPEEAQQTAEMLVGYGIKGFWNFSNTDLYLDDNITVENVHLGDSLMVLKFNYHRNESAANE